MRRLRLWGRLIWLALQLIRRPAQRHRQRVLSEAEAIHRGLGRGYDASLILPEHQRRRP